MNNNHFDKLRALLELEEKEEIRQFNQGFLEKTPEERQLAGNALLRLKIAEMHYSPGGHRLISFAFWDDKALPVNSPDVGDVLCLTKDSPDPLDGPNGTVYEKTTDIITLAFDEKIPGWIDEEGIYQLNISSKRMTYRKMYQALEMVKQADHSRLSFFRDLSFGLRKCESYDPVKDETVSFLNDQLNSFQRDAVKMALASRDIALLHGPPGTGKTTVLIEIIRQIIGEGKFVFATAPSNTACDHLLECLAEAKVPVIRLGHPARIMQHLRKHTLDFKLARHPQSKLADELEAELERLYRKKDRHKDRREFSRDERQEMAERIRQLKEEIQSLEDAIFTQVITETQVMVGTLTSGTDPVLSSKSLDLVVMDEATQATEPAAWIPILRAQKIILAGDHFQLPPTVLSKEAESKGLAKTLFERYHSILGPEWKSLLRIQYRMNEKIMGFSSRQFYGDELIADPSVRHHSLADLEGIKKSAATKEIFLFLDTAGRGFEDKLEPGSESRFNPEEAALAAKKLVELLDAGVQGKDIAVISPYSAQVRLLKTLIRDPGIEIDSVDGFQGREKEAVILSLVRSNLEGELGFLTNTRRMNVALTRARRKLIVIGDSATLSQISFYQEFIRYAESIKAYQSSWEEI